jgi:hypothetical protein
VESRWLLEYIKLFLPIGWVVVSSVVGVLLYRTSDAFFDSLSKDDTSRKRLKLTGSIVIAAVTFFGIYYVTPRGALDPMPSGMQYVSTVALQRFTDNVGAVQDKMLSLSGCLSISPPKDCAGQLQDVQSSVGSLEQSANHLESERK